MIAIGRYLLFIIFLAGTILSVDISPENKKMFLLYIFNLHNEYRFKHSVSDLIYSDEISQEAFNILENVIFKDIAISHNEYGMNISWMPFNDNTKLDIEEAKIVFFKWYNQGYGYNYHIEPQNTETDAFTRIIWSETTTVGIAMSFRENDYAVLVLYKPIGNIEKQFTKNVIRPEVKEKCDDNSRLNN